MSNEKYRMSHTSLIGFGVCLVLLMILLLVRLCDNKQNEPEDRHTIEQVYVVPSDIFEIHINSASVATLKKFGFTNYETVAIISSRDKGYYIRDLEHLKSFRYFDTIKIEALSQYIIYDTIAVRQESHKPRYEKKKHFPKREYDKNMSLYYTTQEEFLDSGVNRSVVDTILEYKRLYYLKGSVKLSELKSATAETIASILESHITGEKEIVKKRELNSVEYEDLVSVPRINSKIANTILKYRSRLGGYVDVEQLREVYGIDSLRYEKIREYFSVDESKVTKIDINKKLDRENFYHPYISSDMMHKLSMNRYGQRITTLEEFRAMYGSDYDNKWLENYLSFEK